MPDSNIPTSRRSVLERGALTATAVSCAALIALAIGRAIGARGFSGNDHDKSALANSCFGVFVLGLLVAVVAGAATWWTRRRAQHHNGVMTGRIVAGYLIAAIIVAAVLNSH